MRSKIATDAPAALRAPTYCRPRRPIPPVTTATRPSRRNRSSTTLDEGRDEGGNRTRDCSLAYRKGGIPGGEGRSKRRRRRARIAHGDGARMAQERKLRTPSLMRSEIERALLLEMVSM